MILLSEIGTLWQSVAHDPTAVASACRGHIVAGLRYMRRDNYTDQAAPTRGRAVR